MESGDWKVESGGQILEKAEGRRKMGEEWRGKEGGRIIKREKEQQQREKMIKGLRTIGRRKMKTFTEIIEIRATKWA